MGSLKRAVRSPPSPPPAEPFEFPSSSSGSPTICIADDVISGGKLLPFCAPPAPPARISKTQLADSLLLPGDRIAAGLRNQSDLDPDPIRRRRRTRWWYQLAFGSVKFPTGMELKEIRIRQQRKPPAKKEGWGPWELLRSLSCKGVEVAGDCHRRIVSPMTEMPLQVLRNDGCVAIR